MNPKNLLSDRAADARPFYVMELLARAAERQKTQGPSISMVVGEPDFPAPPAVAAAAETALRDGRIHYTHALGMRQLREAIAQDYLRRDGLVLDASRIAVTAGGSGALLLAMAALLNPGDEVLMTDPGYPCNRHFVSAAAGVPRMIRVDAAAHFQPTPQQVRAAWGPKTKALLVASPANPTGTLLDPKAAAALLQTVRDLGGVLIVDEIYQRLVFDDTPASLLTLGDDVITINSFSKTYSMTGWRLGWLVAHPSMMVALERLAQNLFISPSSIAQQAAIAAFTPDSLQVAEGYRQKFIEHARFLLPKLQRLGFKIPAKPQGAFYAYCDVSALTDDSYRFCIELCDATGVLMTPGRDFGDHDAHKYLRVSFTKPLELLAEGIDRLERFL